MIYTAQYRENYLCKIRKPLKFYVMDVGEGLMVLIVFPDGRTMMYDCNLLQSNEQEIVDRLYEYIPVCAGERKIDIFVNSHRDKDHLNGLKTINKEFPIKKIWDSGQTGNATDSSYYKYYMNLRLKVGYFEPVPSKMPIGEFGGAKVYCLSSSEHILQESMNRFVFEGLKIQHTNAIVLRIQYGESSLLLTGDSDWYAWKNYIVPSFCTTNLLSSSVLIASHHGSRSFFTDEANEDIDPDRNPDTTYIGALEYINPQFTLISCGNYEKYHHPNKQAVNLYKKYTDNEQVFSTFDFGTFLGEMDYNGKITVRA